MSSLEMREFARFNGLGADPGKIQPIEVLAPWTTLFRSQAEKRKQKQELEVARAQYAREQKTQEAGLVKDMKEFQAREDFRQKVENKLDEIEKEAQVTASAIESVRELAADPDLQGETDLLAKIEADLGGLEAALVEIQAASAIDAGTLDTAELAQSYADAQAALLAIRSVRGRSVGMVDLLKKRKEQLKAETLSAERLRREAQDAAEMQARRNEFAVRQQEILSSTQADEADRRQRTQIMQAVMALDNEIDKEQRAVDRLHSEIDAARQAQAKKAQLASSLAARQASVASMRTGFVKTGLAP